MKIRKLLAAACGCFALLSGATAAYAAETVAEVGGAKYETLEAALGALNAQNSRLTLLSDAAWDAATPVYWKAGTKSGYAATLLDGLKSAFMADGGSITIVCRPGADVGGMTHGHVADDITIYGNKAYVSAGECDLEVDTCTVDRETEAQSSESGLAKDISITAYGLDNLGVWGERKTAHVVTISLNDCDGRAIDGVSGNVQRVYLSGEKAGVNNITLTDCDFITTACAVYSSVDGSLKVENCTFKNVHEPININHKTAGPMTVEVVGTTFTSCGTDGSNYAAPVRVVNSGAGTMSASVAACTFADTVGANGDVLVGDGRDGKTSNAVSLTVSGTAANVQTQQPGCYATKDFTILDATKRATKTVASTATVTATSDGTFKTAIDFDAFIAALEDSNYVLDGSSHELAQDGRLTVKWSPASGCRDERAEHTCTADGVKATGNTPHRLNAGLLQFQMFNGKDCAVSVKNVDFVYEPADVTICANSGWAGTFTAAQASAGQIFIESTGDVAFENCTFDRTVLTSWGCTGATTVRNCVFKNVYDSYAVKDVRGETVEVTGCTFTDCGGAVMVSAADATKVTRVTVSTNAFENVDVAGTAAEGKAGTRGLVQIAAGGDYSGAQFVFAGNVAKNCGPVVRQLNATVAFDATAKSDLSALVSDGQSLYTSDSKKPAVAKVGDVEYGSFEEALAAVQDGGTITLVDDIAVDAAIVASKCPTVASYTLDLNGRTLYAAAEVTLNKGDDVQTVTVKNGKFHATGSSGRFRAEDKATVTIENVEFTTDGSRIGGGPLEGVTEGVCVFQGWGKSENAFTFKGCTFTDCYVSIEGGAGTELSNDVDFINCQFKFTGEKYIENAVKVNYYVGGALDFSGCTFDVKNFAENSSTVCNVTVIDCGSTAASGLSVTLDDTTVTGTTNEKGGSVSLIDVANKSTTTVALAGTTSVTVDGKKVESPVSGAVAKVGDIQYFTLAEALNAALAANDGVEFTTVEIVDDITFAEGDAWEPVAFKKRLNKIEVKGVGGRKTITGMPGPLFANYDISGVDPFGSSIRVGNLKFVNSKVAETANGSEEKFGFAAVILGYAYGFKELTLDGVEIENADVRVHGSGDDSCYAAGFFAWCSGDDDGNVENITIRNCAVRNSKIVGYGTVGGVIGFMSNSSFVKVTIENVEVDGNTIVGTEIKNGAPRTDVIGSVIASVAPGGASVSATVKNNSVYGTRSAVDDETWTKDTDDVTTIYGRGVGNATLTVTGGTYDSAPFAEADSAWAKVAEGCALAGNDTDGWKVECFIKANGVGYATLEAAFAAAEPDADGVVTYEIGGKAEVRGENWIQILKSGLTGVSQVKFVGTSDDAEICLVGQVALLAEQSYDVDVSFTDLILSKPNLCGWVNDINFGASNFTTWLRNVNAAENSVTYTRCTFPNGSGNNQYGKTFYNDCTFCNQASGGNNGYNLWVHGGEAEVNGGTFTGKRGVKLYSVGKDEVPTVTVKGTTFDGLTEKAAVLVSKNSYSDNSGKVTLEDVTVKNCKGLITRDITGGDEATISANGTGISGTFTVASTGDASAAKKEFNLTGGTFTSAVDADYCAKGYEITANDDGTYGVTSHTVAKVGDREFNFLADALTFALKQNDGVPVEIVDDITFDEDDTWTPVPFRNGETLVIKGNGKTISNMHGSLLGSHDLTVDAWNGSLTVTNLKFVDPKDSYTASGGSGAAVILPCAYGMDVTLDGVVIEGADIRAGTDSYVAGFVAWCNGVSGGGKKTVTLKNCAIRNSTLVSHGSVGGLVAFTSATLEEVELVVENCEVTGNTIVGTEIKNGAPRTDIIGAVVATIGAGGASVSAKVTGNSVYGTRSAVDDETWTKDTDDVTTIYGRGVGNATLTVTGGEYDHAPFADDATWASVAEWSKIVEQDGVYKVVDNPVTLGNVAARQRYPWNGLVDVTFELKSQKEVRLFIVAEYANGAETVRLPMAAAKLVNDDGTQSDVDVSAGSFKMAAQETAKTVHVVWDSTTAVPARQSGVTFKVYAK